MYDRLDCCGPLSHSLDASSTSSSSSSSCGGNCREVPPQAWVKPCYSGIMQGSALATINANRGKEQSSTPAPVLPQLASSSAEHTAANVYTYLSSNANSMTAPDTELWTSHTGANPVSCASSSDIDSLLSSIAQPQYHGAAAATEVHLHGRQRSTGSVPLSSTSPGDAGTNNLYKRHLPCSSASDSSASLTGCLSHPQQDQRDDLLDFTSSVLDSGKSRTSTFNSSPVAQSLSGILSASTKLPVTSAVSPQISSCNSSMTPSPASPLCSRMEPSSACLPTTSELLNFGAFPSAAAVTAESHSSASTSFAASSCGSVTETSPSTTNSISSRCASSPEQCDIYTSRY